MKHKPRESDIKHEAGKYWVCDFGAHYAVMVTGNVVSRSESAYTHDAGSVALFRIGRTPLDSQQGLTSLQGSALRAGAGIAPWAHSSARRTIRRGRDERMQAEAED